VSTVTASSLSWLFEELEALEEQGLLRHPVSLSSAQHPEVVIDGRSFLLFCSNNYLDLATDGRVMEAAAYAAMKWGAGAGASRLVSGTTDLHLELERELARFKGCEDAVLFSSGYLANVGTIAALAGEDDAVFSDELNHASIIDGCRMSGARREIYRHADAEHLDELLGKTPARRRLVVTDTIFSMDGDAAPLEELVEVCERHGAMLMVDEAHATGVVGLNGAGMVEAAGLTGRVGVVMGTLSKALGSAGGFVAGSKELAAWLRNRARTHVFDTALPAPSAAAAGEALRIACAEPERRIRTRTGALSLSIGLSELGYEVGDPSAAIVPVYIGEIADAMAMSQRLLEEGIFAPAIRPPSVPPGRSRLRLTMMATHTEEHLDRLLKVFARMKGKRNHHLPLGAGPPARAERRPRSPETVREGWEQWEAASAAAAPRPGADIEPHVRYQGGVFVTGTDTGVGKTVVSAVLARTLASAGLEVGAMKPAQTGVAGGDDDLGAIISLGGVAPEKASAPYAFEEALAPEVAARMAGAVIDAGKIVAGFMALKSRADVVVVEGAGGLLVPLNDYFTMAELARAMALPVVVVARPGLGTINHTALTVEAARMRGLSVLGVILSDFPSDPGAAEATNPTEIERLANTAIIGVVPHLPSLGEGAGFGGADPRRWVSPFLGGCFDRVSFFMELDRRR
jgi:8-amino-7-oxononanoate synthase/dethiobiotin synthase